jgi:hypothetical protein
MDNLILQPQVCVYVPEIYMCYNTCIVTNIKVRLSSDRWAILDVCIFTHSHTQPKPREELYSGLPPIGSGSVLRMP